MFILASLQLLDVVLKKLLGILSDHQLPLHKCCTTNVAFDTMTCAVKEFFSQLELSDESEPRKPNILLCHVLPLISEPVTFLVDKIHSPNCFGMTEPFFETKPCSVALLNLFRDVNSTLKSIQHLSSFNPFVKAPPKTFPHNHVTDSLKFFNLLSGSTLLLSLTYVLLLT